MSDEKKRPRIPQADPAPAAQYDGSEIAIIGMACRFPGADNAQEYWRNLRDGVESLTELTDEELRAAGVTPEEMARESYVRRASVIDGIEDFDAPFFGYTPLEASIIDPQQRLFLECSWEVFEQAGYDPERIGRPVGVFTGSKTNTYLFNVVANRDRLPGLDNFQIALGNDLAAMATRVSFKFDLRGPSYALHTACSTSLVAVHLACQSLLLDECTMAVAGGAAINVPQRRGYTYQTGGLLSPDGSCHTFDAEAAGSNFGNGVGAVLLKRLDDALADRDPIHAILRGTATNNDGSAKASFTAPGVEGQTAVLLEAMACSGVEAEDLSYIEAHGTATDLGDSIEMLALDQAFRASTKKRGFCAIGSVKTNLGHLETAAGIAGLIKTALALEHRQLPPSLHYENPNPKIDFESSPFTVNTELRPWPVPENGIPRRAGVSSFGIGSTNAHAILEEPPLPPATGPSRPWQLLLFSARSPEAVESQGQRLGTWLEEHPAQPLADVAYTLAVGRRAFDHRRVVLCRDGEEARHLLRDLSPEQVWSAQREAAARQVSFLFPGLGEHYTGMGRDLYEQEEVFRRELDRCAGLLEPHLDLDFRPLLYPPQSTEEETPDTADGPDLRRMLGRGRKKESGPLAETRLAQPVLFAVEYALARLWMSWGVHPRGLLGYSLGEYVAACLAGVLTLPDALRLVALRARLIHDLPPGAMLAVPLGESAVAARRQRHGLSLAAVNGPDNTVVSGTPEAVAALTEELTAEGMVCQPLETSHAFHSTLMTPLVDELVALVSTFELSPPQIPYVSNVTGTWITTLEATDPSYWGRHLCQPVRFAEGLRTLGRDPQALLEVGPGMSLSSAVKQHPDLDPAVGRLTFPSMSSSYQSHGDHQTLLATLGRLWLGGHDFDAAGFFAGEERRRLPLPTYPFERRRHWLEMDPEAFRAGRLEGVAASAADTAGAATGAAADTATGTIAGTGRRVTLDKEADLANWFYRPSWRPLDLPPAAENPPSECRLVFLDGEDLGQPLIERWRQAGDTVWVVRRGDEFAQNGESLTIHPAQPADYERLLRALHAADLEPGHIVHLWGLEVDDTSFERLQEHGFWSLLFLAQALGKRPTGGDVRIDVLTRGVSRARGHEALYPGLATVLGPVRVIPQEFPGVSCRNIDLEVGIDLHSPELGLLHQILALPIEEPVLALRGGAVSTLDFSPAPLAEDHSSSKPLRERGTYLLVGGLGGLGLVLAEGMAQEANARLVLTGRTPLPAREAWDDWLENHPQDDSTSQRLRSIRRIEEAGGEVLPLAADVASEEAMVDVLRRTEEHFGTLDGVVHLAGVPGGGIIQLKNRAMAERILAPKVEGARLLTRLLADRELDFLVLFSSIASVLGEFGQVDYCAANAYLDALAQNAVTAGGLPVRTIDWDIWREVGLALHAEVPEHLRPWREEMLQQAILNSEGVEAFRRILASGFEQVVVSTQNLDGRIALGKEFTGESFLAELRKTSGLPGAPQSTPGRALGTSSRALGTPMVLAGGSVERRLAEIWQRVLGLERIGVNDNFFDLGGNSLIGLQLVSEIGRELGVELAPVVLFESPTVAALARHIAPGEAEDEAPQATPQPETGGGKEIAILAMTGRFPGASDLDELWNNLRDGVESITFLSDEELLAAGVDPELVNDPRYVKAASVLEGIDRFDAELFGYSPREAEVMDPQHRAFLECSWEALEKAGYDPQNFPGDIGVFAGSNLSTYLLKLYADPKARASVNMLQAILGNDKDSLTTTLSYKLDLRGPSVAVQTFCSTSLVAVHMACRSLRHGECDMALAGGVRIVVPDRVGYLWEEGGIAPPDGHSRSFDAGANGSVLGQGVGVVVLKRLRDALRDGDPIRAVIRGTAVNNDGSRKAGYTAPSVPGQAKAVERALRDAAVEPESLGYVEAHGSATELGDPIEVTALTAAWRRFTNKRQYCPIGSIKSNFGHLDRAAGVAGLIKAVLALEREEIPPTLHFETPNPQIDFAGSPFVVNDQLRPWPVGETPRRAAVNSLGMGGTNAHVIVEEAPALEPSDPAVPGQLLVLSARTETALDTLAHNLAQHLENSPETNLADVAYTLQVGRRALPWRRMAVCNDPSDAVAVLGGQAPRRAWTTWCEEGERRLVFLFSGLGGQYPGMSRGLYEHYEVFRREVDRCADILTPLLGLDPRQVLYPAQEATGGEESTTDDGKGKVDLRKMLRRQRQEDATPRQIDETWLTQPLVFVVEYALARLLSSFGLEPAAMLGYSVGEYVAATLAGVLSLEDTLEVVARRAKWIDELPAGAMLAVALDEDAATALLDEDLSIASLNGLEQTVIAGPVEAIDTLEQRLVKDDVACRRVQTSHAFHSSMMEPVAQRLIKLVAGKERQPPRIPWISNVTGTWITAEEAMDEAYWARHMSRAVRFADGVREVLGEPDHIFLEVGPGQTLASLLLHQDAEQRRNAPPEDAVERVAVATLRHDYESQEDRAFLLSSLGKLWLAGVNIPWQQLTDGRRRRLELPSYPFERKRFWIETEGEIAVGQVGDKASPADHEEEGARTYYARPGLRVEFVAPRDQDEEAVAQVWRDLLGVDQVGIHDSFLELGGDSLLASRLVVRLREIFGVDLPIRLLFEASTVAELVAAIRQLEQDGRGAEETVEDSGEDQDLEALLAQIQDLPEEELEREILRREELAESVGGGHG